MLVYVLYNIRNSGRSISIIGAANQIYINIAFQYQADTIVFLPAIQR